MTTIEDQERWKSYYDFASGRNPRELLIQAAGRFGDRGQFDGLAVDYGCGMGIETLALLQRGWHVLATDYQQEGIRRLLESVSEEARPRLETQVASFEDVELPSADLIWAGLSLPFCPPQHLDRVLANICSALKPGGRFAGDFFAPRHAWANEAHVTALTEEQIKNAFSSLELEYWIEHEGERMTGMGVQYWHGYGVIYRKPT